MEELARQYAAPVALALVIGYLTRYVEPRSRLVHWFPAWFQFQVPIPNTPTVAAIWTHQLSIQNLGYRAAKAVEVIHQQRPQHFQNQPAVKFTETTNPTGEHVISIETLARKEFVAVQILAVGGQPPNRLGIKSADEPSRLTQIGLYFMISQARQSAMFALLVVGFVRTFYWAVRLVARYGSMFSVR